MKILCVMRPLFLLAVLNAFTESALTLTAPEVSHSSSSTQSDGQSPSFPSTNQLAKIKITLKRNGCLGPCPRYSVTISGNKKVVYGGDSDVRVKGKATSTISRRAVDRLFAQINRMGYFSTPADQSPPCLMDGPTATVTVSEPGRARQIEDFCVDNPEIDRLESAIDEAVNIQQWVFITASRLRELIDNGWNVQKHGEGYVDQAIQWDDPEVIRLLIVSGVPVDAKNYEDQTFLLRAVLGNHYKAAKALLESGANPHAQTSDGWAPAQNAGYRSVAMCQLFLDHGVGINEKDGFGDTMLMNGVSAVGYQESFAIVQFLVNRRAAPNLRNKNGKTAIGRAIEERQQYQQMIQWDSDTRMLPKLSPDKIKAAIEYHSSIVRRYDEVIEYLRQHGGTE